MSRQLALGRWLKLAFSLVGAFTHSSWTKWNTPQPANYNTSFALWAQSCTSSGYFCWCFLDCLVVPPGKIPSQSKASLVTVFSPGPHLVSTIHPHIRPIDQVFHPFPLGFNYLLSSGFHPLDFLDMSQKLVHPVSKTSESLSSSLSVFFEAILTNLKVRDKQALRH